MLTASIVFWDFAWWFVITGGRFAWLVAVISVVAVLACWKFHCDILDVRGRRWGSAEIDVTDRKWNSAGIALPLLLGSIPIVLLLPLVHVGRYSGFGAAVAVALDGGSVALIAGTRLWEWWRAR